jgi:hypothetical protein
MVRASVNSVGAGLLGGVGACGVVVDVPVLDNHAGLEERVEPPQAEEFVAVPAVERLDPAESYWS